MPQIPKFEPARRNPRVGITMLPAKGREGPPPKWPLPGRQSAAEREAWAQLWATPQAFAWQSLGQGCVREVARYCRLAIRAEGEESYAAQHAQATALADRLGLNPKSMRLMLWQIAPEEAERRPEKTPEVPEDELAKRRRLIGDQADVEAGDETA